MFPQKQKILDLDRMPAADFPRDARQEDRMPGAVQALARLVDVDALERGGEAIGVALAADLAVGDDVQARFFLRANRQDGRVILRLREQGLGHAPELLRAQARRKALAELVAVDQPLGLRIAADERGGKEHGRHPCASTKRGEVFLRRSGSMRPLL